MLLARRVVASSALSFRQGQNSAIFLPPLRRFSFAPLLLKQSSSSPKKAPRKPNANKRIALYRRRRASASSASKGFTPARFRLTVDASSPTQAGPRVRSTPLGLSSKPFGQQTVDQKRPRDIRRPSVTSKDQLPSRSFQKTASRSPPQPPSRKASERTSQEITAQAKSPEKTLHSSTATPASSVTSFTSPPLLPGLLTSLQNVLGQSAVPTPIQALSLAHFFPKPDSPSSDPEISEANIASRASKSPKTRTNETLLAAETGTGKSIAYLLPVLQSLKETEPNSESESLHRRTRGPRALILSPTHELCRQLSSFTKSLSHVVKLRTVCLSSPNASGGTGSPDFTRILNELVPQERQGANGQMSRPIDILVGTPSRIADLAGVAFEKPERAGRGKGERERRRGPETRTKPLIHLDSVEWIVVDEADVLLDRDFIGATQALLKAVQSHKTRHDHPSHSETLALPASTPPTSNSTASTSLNLILSTATIPSTLQTYLSTSHPHLTRLTTPSLHSLPRRISTQRIAWTGGNKHADVYQKIVEIQGKDAASSTTDSESGLNSEESSKIIVFCDKTGDVNALGEYLRGRDVQCVTITGESEARKKGSNSHLDGFLKPPTVAASPSPSPSLSASSTSSSLPSPSSATLLNELVSTEPPSTEPTPSPPPPPPRVLITTSLLSRGLDFSPKIKNILIIGEPKSEADFLHRAGRAGRAGNVGNVVIFGRKEKGGKAAAKGRGKSGLKLKLGGFKREGVKLNLNSKSKSKFSSSRAGGGGKKIRS